MSVRKTECVLRLHLDRNRLVWFGDDAEPAVCTGKPLDAFFEEDAAEHLDAAGVVRLLGVRENAALVVKLQQQKNRVETFREVPVELGAPAVLPSAAHRDDPEAVLYHIWQPPAASNLAGHWHTLTLLDCVTYSLIDGAGDGYREVPDGLLALAKYHPAWAALTFLPGVDKSAAVHLLCDITDPRWYLHPTRPARLTRMFSHLGLTPQNFAACEGSAPRGRHFTRAANAARVWYNLRTKREGDRDPGDFLLRQLAGHTRLDTGLLRCTQRLVELVAGVWLAAVRRPHAEVTGFDPQKFFTPAREAKAFAAHAALAAERD